MERTQILASDLPATRLGQLVLAGQLIDDVPAVPGPLRVMEHYVLSVVFKGRGRYRHADRRVEPVTAGAVMVLRPGQPHWYGTDRGERWTEVFAVFRGPLFDTFAQAGLLSHDGPRYPSPPPAMAALRAILRASPTAQRAAEHQLLALAGWLLDVAPQPDGGGTPEIAAAAERLASQLDHPVDLRALAAEVGLPYDTFRRRFTAEIGKPPAAYRNERRLAAAASLLRLTDMTVRAIARTLGYVDEFHLSRRFKAHYGLSPRDFRRSQ